MSPGVRRLVVVLGALGLAATLVVGRERPGGEIAEPAARIDARVRVPELDLSRLERAAPAEGEAAKDAAAVDLFAARSFAPEAAPAKPGAAPKPVAPPLPFTYLGRMLEDGKLAVFLQHNGENLSVAEGAKIGEYRLDAVSDKELTFTYLPLKTKQKLPL